MGKRELLLVAAFAIMGVVVYHFTAPPPPPGGGFSISRIVQSMRRGIQGNRASAEITRTRVERIDSTVQELRFVLGYIDVNVLGEEREDVEILAHITSNGFDDAEAKRLAEATQLVVTRAGSALVFALNAPREGVQRAKLTLKVPARLRVRVEPGRGQLTLSNLSGVEVMGMSGDTTVKDVRGSVVINHRGGELAVDGAAALKLTTRGGDVKVQRISGTVTTQAFGGELTLADVRGPVEIEARNTDVRLENIKSMSPPLRIDGTNGSVTIVGLRTEARIDGRGTEVAVDFDAPAPATVYSTSEDIEITPPPGGYALDAVATDGRITISDGTLKATGTETEQRVTGPVRGGGPTLTLRATRADIVVRARE